MSEYKIGLAKNVYVIENATNNLNGNYNFNGRDRWLTLQLVLKYLGK